MGDRPISIPTFEVAIGSDFLFTTKQVRDQLALLSSAAIAAATFTVEIYDAAFPAGSVLTTLTGAIITSTGKDFYAIWPDSNGVQGTDQLTNDQDLWAKYIVDAGANAKGVAFAKLRAKGA